MSVKKKHLISLVLIFLFSIIYMLPVLTTENIYHFTDQDTAFHLSRITGLSNVFTSPVNFTNFGGNGTAMNIFYPWLTLYPAYIFFQLTGNLVTAYNLYYLFFTIVTMLVAYICMYKIQRKHLSSLIFSLIYSFAAYRSTDIFFRGSLGEAIAFTFLPLVFLGCYYVFYDDYRNWFWLTIGMTLTVYTHLLSVLFNALFILVTVCVSIFFMKDKKNRIVALIKATMCTIFISLAAFIPMLEQSSFVSLKVPKGGELRGLRVSDYLAETMNNNLQYFGIGLVIFLISIYTYNRRKELTNFNLHIYYFGLLAVLASTSLFPWFIVQKTPLTVIQFPWRLTAYATLFLAYAGSVSLSKNIKSRKMKINKFLIISISLIIMHGVSVHNLLVQDDKAVYNNNDAIEMAHSYAHTDYANEESLNHPELVRNKSFMVNNDIIDIDYTITDTSITFEHENKDNNPIKVVTPLYFYKGQMVEVNGSKVESSLSDYGTTELFINPGKSHVKIYYNYTKLARVTQAISFLSILFFIFYVYKRRKEIKKKNLKGNTE